MISSVIVYWMAGLNATAEQFFTFYLIIVLLSFNGGSLGYLVGSIVEDPKSVGTLIPVILIPFVLFSGQFKNFSSLPNWIGWVQYLSPLKYAFTAFVSN